MGTKQQTNTSNQYNQAGMTAYNSFQPQLMSSLLQMSQNPLGNSYFQNQLAQQQAQSQQIGQRSTSNALQNLRTGGGVLSNSGGFTAAMVNRNNIANSGMQANAFNSSLNSALSNRNMALASMQAYQPLQTGQQSTQTTSGLGTWLPQLAGAAAGAFMPGIGSMLGGASFSSGYGGAGQLGGSAAGAMGMPPASGGMSGNPWGAGPSGGGSGMFFG
jgi:hypothetical protein